MTRRTAVRRSAVLGLGAVGTLLLAAPASALDVGAAVQQVAEQAPAAAVVDPLTAPLQATDPALDPVLDPVIDPVLEAAEPVVQAAPEPVRQPVQQVVAQVRGEAVPAGDGSPTPTDAPPAGPPAPAAQVPQQPAAPTAPGAPAPAPAGGTGVAAMPSSFTRSATGLEGFGGRGAGVGTAANPMSLFGAPQVATVPQLDIDLPTPLAIEPAGARFADVLPVDAPEGLPAALVALACTVVAGAVAAHVAALRSRRTAVPA